MLNVSGFINISDSDKKFEPIEDTIKKGFIDNDLEKGKKFPIGTIHNGYKKVSEGVWKKVSTHGLTHAEHEAKSKEAINHLQNKTGEKTATQLDEEDAHHQRAMQSIDDKEYSDKDVAKESPVTMDTLKKIAKTTNSDVDFIDKLNKYKNVPDKLMTEFIEKYGANKSGRGIHTAVRNFREEQNHLNKKEEKPKESKPITLDTFKELAKKSKSPQELFDKIREVKNVPSKVASEFFEKYGSGGKDTPQEAVKKFFNEHNKSDSKDQDITLGSTKIESDNTVDFIKEAATKGYKKVKVEFVPAYDESKHKDIQNKELIDSMKKTKVEEFDVVDDASDIIKLLKNKDVKEIKFTK